ncbi:MAG: HDOD domain-containing protein [bacterium]|nr:HDOD domain-containing protein [bacterium]
MKDKTILKKLAASGELPSFPAVVGKLQSLLAGSDPSIEMASELVIEDPGISARVVKLAGSSLFNPRGAPVDTLEQAVGRIGLTELQSIVSAIAIAGACEGIAENVFARRVWAHSLTTGIAAGLLVQFCGELPDLPPRSNPYYLAGMTHDLGALMLEGLLKDRYRVLRDRSATTGTPICEVETEELGFSHAEAGSVILASWELSDSIAAVARYHHSPEAAPEKFRTDVTLIHVAEWLAEHRGYGWGESGATLCDQGWEQLGISLESIDDLLHAFDQAAKDSEQFLNATFG